MSSMPERLPATLVLPPITSIPGRTAPPEAPSALEGFLADGTRRWDREPVHMPVGVAVTLRLVLVAALAAVAWLAAVQAGAVSCTGFPCALTTWWRPVPMFWIAVVGAALLVGAAAVSRVFAQMSAVSLPAALVGACCGLVAVSGAVALAVLAVAGITAVLAVLVTVLERA